AFNALLKTLEEPPPHVVFVLATTAPKKIPLTVLSRCQHLPFKRIPVYRIRERLKKITEAEDITISGPALEMIARAADGSMRDGLTVLDQIASFSSDISESDVRDLLGIAEFGLLSHIAEALLEGKREDILKLSGELTEKGTDIRSFMKELIQFFRDLLVASISKKPEEILDLGGEEMDSLKRIGGMTSEDQLTLVLSELLKAEGEIRSASSPRLAFEMSLLRISFLSDMPPVRKIIENLESYARLSAGSDGAVESRQSAGIERSGGGIQETGETSSAENAEEIVDDTEMSDSVAEADRPEETVRANMLSAEIWERILKRMEPPLASKLAMADYTFTGDKLVLTLNGGDSVFADSIKKNSGVIGEIFTEELGGKVTVKVETVKRKTAREKDLKEKVLADPAIQEVLELFDGKIVDVTPSKEDRI
ncbi:MAG: hypothetical protein AB1442_10775, partial [Nitrospirota bacterium]